MTPEKILSCPARVLSQAQREQYFEVGYVMVENLIPANVIDQLVDTTDKYLDRSRSVMQSDDTFDDRGRFIPADQIQNFQFTFGTSF